MTTPLPFDPMAHLFEKGVNIAHIPISTGDSKQLLRWSTYALANPFEPIRNVREALEIARLQQLHIGKFALLGVIVSLHEGQSFISTSPDGTGHIALYNVVDYIEAEPLDLPGVHNQAQYELMSDIWQSYWNWVTETRQPYYLSDLSKHDAWGHTNNKLVLFDIEPLFSSTGYMEA